MQVCVRDIQYLRVVLKLRTYHSGTQGWGRLRDLNKGLKCPLTVKYISMTLSGMSKSSEN